ncbi:hypothetical protein ACRALDRAFT_1037863 [Sodiomyces alcalophilus JCM 7366]|uniref:uncharacterized protein n=1 Tax=Sodiomyces alcalophilus JCM 7366 TaxID=591952 RepID=UPI0039B523F0
MLFYSGVTQRTGDVNTGNTVTDFLDLERERGITIQSAAITFRWPLPEACQPTTVEVRPKIINLIDTPGHQDFRFEVDRCLPILDGAVCIIDAVKGVEAHTERVWASAREHAIPCIVYVNKLDREGASFRKSVLEVASRLHGWPLVCQIPWWERGQFVGVIDVIDRVGHKWKSEKQKATYQGDALKRALADNHKLAEEMETARERLIEVLAESDETLLELFANDPSRITSQAIKDGIRRAVRGGDGKVVPILAGASFRHMGVEPLMTAIVDYLPSPDERPELEIRVGDSNQSLSELLNTHHGKHGKDRRLAAIASVFKVFHHPKEGMLSFVRIYHGDLHRTASVWNTHSLMHEAPLGLLEISAAKTETVQFLSKGQIGAIKGLRKARTGDTLVTTATGKGIPDGLRHIQVRPAEVPLPVAFLAMEPYGNVAAQELEVALDQMSRQDPSLRWNRDEKSRQFILQGMGKLHLEVAVHELRQKIKAQVDYGPIEVDYKECLTAPIGPITVTFEKPVAGKAGKVTCTAILKPLTSCHDRSELNTGKEKYGNMIHVILEESEVLDFDQEEARQQLLNGVVAAMARGPRRSSPVQGCHITLVVDTSPPCLDSPTGGHFSGAAYQVVRESLRRARANHVVGILEPNMLVRICCPEAVAGQVQHDISSGAGGHILEIKDRSAEVSSGTVDIAKVYAPPDPYDSVTSLREKKSSRMVEVIAKVPFKEVLDFDQKLRTRTGGRHSMTMAFHSFDRVVGPREKDL